MKLCSKCKESKDIEQFYRAGSGRRSACKACESRTSKSRDNRSSWRKASLRYYNKNKDKINTRKRYERYALTEEEYYGLLSHFNGECAICGSKDNLCIDHDHSTNEVRGLLCLTCNSGLGMFKDDCDQLAKAIEYIKAHKAGKGVWWPPSSHTGSL